MEPRKIWILCILISCIKSKTTCVGQEYESAPQDGFFNNLIHPDWGSIDSQLIRRSPPKYMDGVYEPAGQNRPNPFDLSNVAHSGEAGLGSARNRTAMLVYFGQQIVEEILDVQRPGCPREFFNIPVPRNHLLNPDGLDNLEMPFQRSRYDHKTGQSPNNPRQQISEITPFIDGTVIYGPGKTWTDAIREFKNGRLKPDNPTEQDVKQQFPVKNNIKLPFANPPPPRDHYLKPVNRFFRIGNPRGFENPFILSLQVLWFRYHNFVAKKYADLHGTEWNDEQIFNAAKDKVIAVHQKIIMYDWLPRWLNINSDGLRNFALPPYYHDNKNCNEYCRYNGYDSEVNPGIAQEFQTAAMRFGHTLVTPGLWLRGKPSKTNKCPWKKIQIQVPNQPKTVHAVRLCNAFWNSQDTVEPMVEDILRGMASTLSEREDNIVVPDLREHLFGPLEFSRRDVAAINIQRAREHGIADYNTIREAYGLQRITKWNDINNNTKMSKVIDDLKNLYGNHSFNITAPNDLDLFVGGLLETTEDGPGELFKKILLDQFLRIRHGDRFWFENKELKRHFTVDEIFNITLKQVILDATHITEEEIQDDVFINSVEDKDNLPCRQPSQLKADSYVLSSDNQTVIMENCTRVQHYDYFSGSEISFILSFLALALFIPATVGVMMFMARRRQRKMQMVRRKKTAKRSSDNPYHFQAIEWIGPVSGERNIRIEFDNNRKKIHVTDMRKKPLRMIDLRRAGDQGVQFHFRLSTDGSINIISLRLKGEIDLVLRFVDGEERTKFQKNLEKFLNELGINREIHEFPEKMIFDNAETKEERQKLLDLFFRVICLQAFNKSPGQLDLENISGDDIKRIAHIELTRTEFADALGLKPNSIFVRNMFLMFDLDKDGFIGFKEFLDMFVVLSSGTAEDKARLIFNMYDLKHQGKLTKDKFRNMIKSLLDLADSTVASEDLEQLVQSMYQIAGLQPNDDVDFSSFQKIFASEEYEGTLNSATLGIEALGKEGHQDMTQKQKRKSDFLKSYRMKHRKYQDNSKQVATDRRDAKLKINTKTKTFPQTKVGKYVYEFTRYVENYRLQIFWVTLYTLVTIGIFAERAFYYSFEREHVGLRRIAGYGVTVTRGAASVMMFTYTSLLVTMSRNTITFLRETFLHRFIPFDSAHDFHKLIAGMALVATLMHCIGHGINLYHICTQASTDLNCVFREYFRETDVLASFHYWAYTTVTGLTGIILTIIVIVMYVFALPYARRNVFNAFWFTHSWYILLYMFTVMHGTGRLVQMPIFQFYFIGPAVIYVFDKIISLSRNKVAIDVFSAEILPSDVTALKFKRPLNFEYKSGQWIRIACAKLGESEYHPFTLTSAPHEDFLSLHIRAVGPWTTNLRTVYDANRHDIDTYVPPKVLVDGPFGEGHQDWYKFPVAVLVGGGIGVTPFASILKDIVYKSTGPIRFPCQKVYFLWVTRTQKQFEWLTDIIQEVENNDPQNLVTVHIFITQFRQKYDLRTTMLYICERHFQKIAGKSLFTGLKAVTHFGRPRFQDFLESLHYVHPNAKQIGVFSCGPPPMTLSVNRACSNANKNEGFPTYHHHYENF